MLYTSPHLDTIHPTQSNLFTHSLRCYIRLWRVIGWITLSHHSREAWILTQIAPQGILEIFQVSGNLSCGFPKTSLVLVEHGYNPSRKYYKTRPSSSSLWCSRDPTHSSLIFCRKCFSDHVAHYQAYETSERLQPFPFSPLSKTISSWLRVRPPSPASVTPVYHKRHAISVWSVCFSIPSTKEWKRSWKLRLEALSTSPVSIFLWGKFN